MTTNAIDDPIERKVQITGGSTYTISLPKEWAIDRGIENGTPLYLYAGEDHLVASRERDPSDRSVTIDADAVEDEALEDTVVTAYVAGYDEIALTSASGFDPAQRRAIRSAVVGLVGVELGSQRPREITLRNLLDDDEVSLRQTVAQMCQTALTMHEDAVGAVVDGDDSLARRVVDQDDDVDRLFGLVSRQFHRGLADFRQLPRLDVDRPAAFAYYRSARQLERVADHAEKIADVARRQSSPPPAELADDLVELGERSRSIVRSATDEQLDAPSPSGLWTAISRRDALVEDVRALDRQLYGGDAPEPHLLATALDSVERTAEYGANVAEMALQSALRGRDGDDEVDGFAD